MPKRGIRVKSTLPTLVLDSLEALPPEKPRRPYIQALRRLARESGCPLIVIYHARKPAP